MATVIFRGDADTVAQESRATPANVEIGDEFTLTVGDSSVSFAATEASVANVTAGLVAAWNASASPELAEITAYDADTYVKLLADVAGRPFVVTSTATNGGSNDTQTLAITTPVAAAGPNCWDTPANWSTGSVPVDDDDIIIEDSDVDILYGLDQSAVTPDTLKIRASYTGKIGLTPINETGDTDYAEYRETRLKISPDVINIGEGQGNGSPMIRLDTGEIQTVLTVYSTGVASDSSHGALQYIGEHFTQNTLTVLKGDVGIATRGGEEAYIHQLNVAYSSSPMSDAIVRCGDDAHISNVYQIGGNLTMNGIPGSMYQTGGVCEVFGATLISQIHVAGGTLYHNSTGLAGNAVTNLIVSGSGTVDFSRSVGDRVITNCDVHTGATILDPHHNVTWTNGIDANQCDPFGDVQLSLGRGQRLSFSAIPI